MKFKHLITIIFGLCLIPLSCSAISLDELQSQPNIYKKITDSKEHTLYADLNSIKSIRYAPPYYTLQSKLYLVEYNNIGIIESTTLFNYDYNRTTSSLIKKIVWENPNLSDDEFYKRLQQELREDSGITCSHLDYKLYSYSGNRKNTYGPQPQKYSAEKVEYASSLYITANVIFQKAYNESFILYELK